MKSKSTPAPPFAELAIERFEALKSGDVLVNRAGDKACCIAQIRLPGLYVVAQVDPRTHERIGSGLTMLDSRAGLALAPRKN